MLPTALKSALVGTLIMLWSATALAVQPLEITSVHVDYDLSLIIINGVNFDNGNDLEVNLSDFHDITSVEPSPTQIIAHFAAGTLPPGNYLLTITTGGGSVRFDEIAITVGMDGPAGEKGEIGDQGIPGETGAQGEQGLQGEPGIAGSPGANGATGPQGEQGVAGQAGPAGPQGEQGVAGPQGVDGAPGEQGAPGNDGAPGTTGDTGAQGPQGEVGPAGAAGAQGPQGLPGQPEDRTADLCAMYFSLYAQALIGNLFPPDYCSPQQGEQCADRLNFRCALGLICESGICVVGGGPGPGANCTPPLVEDEFGQCVPPVAPPILAFANVNIISIFNVPPTTFSVQVGFVEEAPDVSLLRIMFFENAVCTGTSFATTDLVWDLPNENEPYLRSGTGQIGAVLTPGVTHALVYIVDDGLGQSSNSLCVAVSD